MSAANTATACRWFEEVWNQRREETIDELVGPESVCHVSMGPPMVGPEEFKTRVHRLFLAAFPDVTITIEGTITDGDQVAVRWLSEATHSGDGLGFPATGRKVSFRGITWIRFEDGRMVEGLDCWDQTGLIQSLRSPG